MQWAEDPTDSLSVVLIQNPCHYHTHPHSLIANLKLSLHPQPSLLQMYQHTWLISSSHLQNLVELFLVLHNYDVGLAVTGNKVAGFWPVSGVDTSRETSGRGTQEVSLPL